MTSPSTRGLLLPAPEVNDPSSPADARDVLRLLAQLRPGKSWLTRVENLYIALFTIGVLVAVTWTVSRRIGGLFVDVAGFYRSVWGPALIVLLFLGVFRYSTVQGFVSFSEADCLYLLPAPLRRSALVRPRLLSATVLLGAAGAIVGILALVGSSGSHSGLRVGEAALSGLALGMLLVVGSWHVQRLRWATAWAMRLTIPLIGLAILLAFAQSGGHEAKVAGLWSGPWGWGILPLVSDAPSYGVVGLGLLWALTLAGVVSLYRTAGHCTIEGFRMRARTRSQVVASLYAFDYRTIGQAARGDKAQTWQGRLRLRAPARPMLSIPWHGALALLRSPIRLGWGIVLAGAGVFLLTLQPYRMGALWAGGAALYLAASSLLEPLRQEVDTPGAAKVLLPWRFERILWLHCLLPAAIMVLAGALTLAAGLASGYLRGQPVVTLAILLVPLTSVAVFSAGLSGRRGGRVSTNMVQLAAMDTTGFSWIFVIIQLAIWAILSLVATVVSVWLLGTADFALRPLLAGEFGILALLAFAMQRGVSAKMGPGFMERMLEAQRGSAQT